MSHIFITNNLEEWPFEYVCITSTSAPSRLSSHPGKQDKRILESCVNCQESSCKLTHNKTSHDKPFFNCHNKMVVDVHFWLTILFIYLFKIYFL